MIQTLLELIRRIVSINTSSTASSSPLVQAKQHLRRFLSAPSAERSSVLVLTNAAVARSPVIGQVPNAAANSVKAVHFDAPEGPKNAAARARVVKGLFGGRHSGMTEEVHLEGGMGAAGVAPFVFESGAMGGICSRWVGR